MDYQVLARKWRPQTFNEIVGQEHATQALTNALTQQRIHHALLFTGMQGVGKTSIARIIAKCLNCETGVTATPCRQCDPCQAIEAGNFVDLLEIDAASRTKVEDTRDLLDNVQYLPTRGRYKVYLIDEVHMLSGHSFNALLKTLEEPPKHVIFLLATTDPHRLPITILSRCIQFHLKRVAASRIATHLESVLMAEKISFETAAIQQLSQAAKGSIRDALSLLDQAIAYGNGKLTADDVAAMLGNVNADHISTIVQALADQNAEQLLACSNQLTSLACDHQQVLAALLSLLHQITIAQIAPNALTGDEAMRDRLISFSKQFKPEDIQLYYQIGAIGQRDLPLAPTPQIGFEMTLLRMLAFQPQTQTPSLQKQPPRQQSKPSTQTQTPTVTSPPTNTVNKHTAQWQTIVKQLGLTGITQALASHCCVNEISDNSINLTLDSQQTALLNGKQKQRLNDALDNYFGKPMTLRIDTGKPGNETPARHDLRRQQENHAHAVKSLNADANISNIIDTFDATIDVNTIEPTKEV